MLYPPPEATQPGSRSPGALWQFTGGLTLSTPAPVTAFVQRYVPPTVVTSGSDAGQLTLGYGMIREFFTGTFMLLVVPPSPLEANTVTFAARAFSNVVRSCLSEASPSLNAPSPEPKLWLITSIFPLSMSAVSAFIICWKPWTPSTSAVGVVRSTMFASGAVACAHSTSSATSRSQRLWFSSPVPLLGGGGVGGGQPCTQTMSKRGDTVDAQLADGSLGPLSPQRCGSPKAVLKMPRSDRMVEAPNESTTTIVLPRSEEHTSELQSPYDLVCRLLLEKKNKTQ